MVQIYDKKDYDKYDMIIGMDSANYRNINRICGGDSKNKIYLLMDFTSSPHDVADPWYTRNFDTTWEDINEGCKALLNKIID